MYDLFISYSSHDRPWAEKLYRDLTSAYPTIKVFWDRAAIPAGAPWRTFLKGANVNTTHLAIFWSEKANDSKEVGPEIEAFEADVARAPKRGTSKRLEFYCPLKGERGGGIADIQGFPELSNYYDPNLEDRGVSKLDAGAGLLEWKRTIRMIGDAILSADSKQKVIAAIVATNQSHFPMVDAMRSLAQTASGLTLDHFLEQFGLTWAQVSPRYGATARDWHPYGAAETIVDLLEELRVQANSRLDPAYWFRWEHVDLIELVKGDPTAKRLSQEPSVVIVDSISLFDIAVANTFRQLAEYISNERSIVLSLAPLGQSGVDVLADALRWQSIPLLDDYFHPKIPPMCGFARCSINVQRIDEIERFVRSRLGWLHLNKKTAEARDITGVGN